jgi:hypothetical protein
MGLVNGRREERALESDSEPPAPAQGAQPLARNGRIPGLFRTDHSAERVSPEGILAERQELSSNPLRAYFNDLRTTLISVDVDWRIVEPLRGSGASIINKSWPKLSRRDWFGAGRYARSDRACPLHGEGAKSTISALANLSHRNLPTQPSSGSLWPGRTARACGRQRRTCGCPRSASRRP